MIEILFIAKILTSIIFVVALSVIAENVSPKVAGILSGFPLGTAIALFFIGIENGKDFAANSAIYTLSGFSASLVLVYFYYKISSLITTRHNVLVSSIIAIIAFSLVAKTLSLFSLGLVGGFIISVGSIIYFSLKFRIIENTVVVKKIRFTQWVLLIRALVAAAIVLFITGIAKLVGSNVAGILSAFPITLFPFLVIIHLTYGKEQVHTIIKHYPSGLGALITYVISVSYTYPLFGVVNGTLLSFLFAIIYLVLFFIFTKIRR